MHWNLLFQVSNGWSIFIDKLSKTPTITKELEEALSRLKTINLANIKSAKDLGLQIGYTDEQFLNFAQQADLSGDVLQQYKDYISASSAATSAFGTTLKSIAVSYTHLHGLIINKSIQKTGGQNYEFKHGKQAVL